MKEALVFAFIASDKQQNRNIKETAISRLHKSRFHRIYEDASKTAVCVGKEASFSFMFTSVQPSIQDCWFGMDLFEHSSTHRCARLLND